MLVFDLRVLHRSAREVPLKEAIVWTGFWVALGLVFGLVVLLWLGGESAAQYYTGYLIEWSLSIDNVFVFALVFTYFGTPIEFQHRVLFWGIIGALVFRAAFIIAGAALLERVSWTQYTLGFFLVLASGWMIARRKEQVQPEHNPLVRLARHFVPLTDGLRGDRFFVRSSGRLVATPLLLVLITVETTDIVFAIDSIPAILAITTNAFVVFSANAFAVLGLRSLYFCVADAMKRFAYLRIGLAAVLLFVGVKLVLADVAGEPPVVVSLVVILALIGASVAASLLIRPARE